jgi:hypothetical protein
MDMERKLTTAAGHSRTLPRLAQVAAVALLVAGSASAFDPGPIHLDGLSNGHSIIGRALAAAGTHGLQTVDPLSLNPPALIEYEPWFHAIPYDKCWKGASEITCVAYLRTFQVGDGSLGGADGLPVDWGIVCDQGYSLYQEFRNTWAIVRFYTLNGDIVSRYRLEIGEGTVYNSVSGKAAKLWFDDLFASTWSPPGALESETITIYGNDWSAATMKGKPLAHSYGVVTFFPDGTWQQKGAHPLDAYFFGDPSGIAPVCAYVK